VSVSKSADAHHGGVGWHAHARVGMIRRPFPVWLRTRDHRTRVARNV